MRNITEFIEQLESGKHHFSIWAYSSKGHYCKIGTQSNKWHTPQLLKAIEKHLQGIKPRLKQSGLKALGIMIDADENISGRWFSIKDRLIDVGYSNIPKNPEIGSSLSFIIEPPISGFFGIFE